MRLARVEQVVRDFILDPMGERVKCGGTKERVAVTPGDCGEKPLNCPVGSCGKSTEEVILLTPCPKPSHVPLGSSGRKLQISFGALREGPSSKVMHQKAQLKCLSTNARRMQNKQEELEAMMCLENTDLVATRETWWDKSHNRHTEIEGCRLFRRDRQGKGGGGGGVALYVTKWTVCKELCLSDSHDQVES